MVPRSWAPWPTLFLACTPPDRPARLPEPLPGELLSYLGSGLDQCPLSFMRASPTTSFGPGGVRGRCTFCAWSWRDVIWA